MVGVKGKRRQKSELFGLELNVSWRRYKLYLCFTDG